MQHKHQAGWTENGQQNCRFAHMGQDEASVIADPMPKGRRTRSPERGAMSRRL